MSILAQNYAQGGDVILHVIELACKSWSEPIVLVRDYVPHTFTTEDGRTLHAIPSGIGLSLPKRDASGAQNLTFSLDGVRPEATNLLRQANSEGELISLVHREYLASDKTEPADKPYYLVVRRFLAKNDHVEVTAGLFDLIDMRWPRAVYDSETAPGLKYFK